MVGWLVGLMGLTALLDSISVYIGPSPKAGEKEERRIDETKKVQTTPTRTYCEHSRPLPYCIHRAVSQRGGERGEKDR